MRRAGSRCRSSRTAESTSRSRTCRPTTTWSSSATSRQAYDRLVGEDYVPQNGPNLALDDLQRQGAETPTNDLQHVAVQPVVLGSDELGSDPQHGGVQPVGVVALGVVSVGMELVAVVSLRVVARPRGLRPRGLPSAWSPSAWSPSAWSASQWSPSAWSSSNPSDPKAFSSAQTASVVAVSGGTGTGNESVSVNTWNNTGNFYVRVSGKNGSFDPTKNFTLDVARQGNPCAGVNDVASTPTAPTGDRNTLILVDNSRLTLGTSPTATLNQFAARPEVKGVVVNVGADTAVSALNAQANGKPGCPYAKNLVAVGHHADRERLPEDQPDQVRRDRRRRLGHPVLPLCGSGASREREPVRAARPRQHGIAGEPATQLRAESGRVRLE